MALLQPGPGEPDGRAHRPDGLLLADDPLMEELLELEELLPLLGRQLGHGIPVRAETISATCSALTSGEPEAMAFFQRSVAAASSSSLAPDRPLDLLGLIELLPGGSILLFPPELLDLGLELLDLCGPRGRGDPHLGRRLIDEVDRLVREVTAGDVAVGELRRGADGLIADPDLMVGFEPVP
jgi:hypothetical protein